MSSWRFYFDHHVPESIAVGLRRFGVDVLATHQVGNEELSDEDQLAYAIEHGLVLFTHDEDLLSIAAQWATEGREHLGLVYCHQLRYSIGERIRRLKALTETREPEHLRNLVHFL